MCIPVYSPKKCLTPVVYEGTSFFLTISSPPYSCLAPASILFPHSSHHSSSPHLSPSPCQPRFSVSLSSQPLFLPHVFFTPFHVILSFILSFFSQPPPTLSSHPSLPLSHILSCSILPHTYLIPPQRIWSPSSTQHSSLSMRPWLPSSMLMAQTPSWRTKG